MEFGVRDQSLGFRVQDLGLSFEGVEAEVQIMQYGMKV